MQCPECNSNLEEDDEIDTSVIDADSCQINFKCINEDCAKHFCVEFSPIDITEI